MKKPSLITRIRNRYMKVLKGESGQSTTEYILILAIVVMIASKMRTQLVGKVEKSMKMIDNEMGKFESMDP